MTPNTTPLRNQPASRHAADGARARGLHLGIFGKTMATMIAVALLPLALFGGFALREQGGHVRGDAEKALQTTAEHISGQVDEWFDKNVRVLKATAGLVEMSAMHGETQAHVLAAVKQAYPWMYLVFTVAPDGKNVARSDDKPLTDYSDRQYYKDVVANGKELAWETVFGRTNNKPALVIAVPIRAGGHVVGVLAAAMTIEDISHWVADWKTGSTGFAFLVDEKAKVIAHPRQEFVVSQAHLNDHPLITAFRADPQPHLVAFTQSDGGKALGYVRGNRFGWAVAVQQDEREVFAPVRRTLALGVSLLAAAAVLTTLVALFSARMLIHPIVQMTEAADRMSMGELETPIVLARRDELGLLAHALERLRRSMKAALDRLRPAS